MKQNLAWFLGTDLFSGFTYYFLQIGVNDYVIDNTMRVFAALFVGFIGGFMGVLGKRVGEDYLKKNKNKKDANEKP